MAEPVRVQHEKRAELVEMLTNYVIMLTGPDIAAMSFAERVVARSLVRSAVADEIINLFNTPPDGEADPSIQVRE